MEFLFEIAPNVLDVEKLTESESNSKSFKVSGIFASIGLRNNNKRVYSREIWETEVANYQEVLKNGSPNSLMEYKHPPRTSVELMSAVAKITKLWIEGDFVYGEAIICFDNPESVQIRQLIENGIKIGVSSRGVGSVDQHGNVTRFKLITFDIVPDPSDQNAIINSINESLEIVSSYDISINESGEIVVDKKPKKEDEKIDKKVKKADKNLDPNVEKKDQSIKEETTSGDIASVTSRMDLTQRRKLITSALSKILIEEIRKYK